MGKLLSIGISTFDDYDGCFFTIQSLRMYHPVCNTDLCEFIILDNNPRGVHSNELKKLASRSKAKYIPYSEIQSSFNKYRCIGCATGDVYMGLDSHVMIEHGGVSRLLTYFLCNDNCKDLVQGPLWHDTLSGFSTHFEPEFRDDMYGTWACNEDGYAKGKPFVIPMQGMGMFAFKRSAWMGINQNFIGFGGEEGYIAEKFRQNGGKNICLPGCKWVHRFGRPDKPKYRLLLEDRVFNYFLGWLEIYKDISHPFIAKIYDHFSTRLPMQKLDSLLEKAVKLNNL